MGQAAPSSLLSKDEAAALLGPGLARRIEEGFRRGSGAAGPQGGLEEEGASGVLSSSVWGGGGSDGPAGTLLSAATGGLWGSGGGGGKAAASSASAAVAVEVGRRAFHRFLGEAVPRMVRFGFFVGVEGG